MSRLLRFSALLLVALSLAGCGSFSLFEGFTTGSVAPPAPAANGHVYLFRGMGGQLMSRGMDMLADKINRAGIKATVYNHMFWGEPADEAIARYKRDPNHPPIILIGHSAGADATLYFAGRLKEAGVPVSLIVTFDPTRKAPNVPSNVERYVNLYQSLNFFGGGDVGPASDFHGHFASVNLKKYWEVLHVNLVKMEALQSAVFAKIVQVTTLPTSLAGPAIPIEYVVPRDVEIEVWDSGMPVIAEAGDTLQTLSRQYAVPVWAIAQINRMAESAALRPGQKLVMPRHLEAIPPAPAPLTSFMPTAAQ
jgi:pimeloyl-ACP methyl ester carboxylesterase